MVPRTATAGVIVAGLTFPSLLAAQAPVLLDTVRVTAVSRLPTSGTTQFRSMVIIERDELARRAAGTVADILATTLGVDIDPRSAAQADVSIRGSTFEQVLVLVDGSRASDAQTGHFNLDLAVPLDMIERIEILRGPGSALYGADAIGGVINIVTRGAGKSDARVWGGSFGTIGAAASGGATLGSARVHGGADYTRSDGHRPGTDFAITQVRLAADLPLPGIQRQRSSRVFANVGLGVRDFGAADFYGPYPSYERTRTGTAALRYESRRDRPWALHASLSSRRHSDVFTLVRDDPALYQNRHVSWQSTAELVTRYTTAGPWRLAVGGEAMDLQLASERLGDRRERRGGFFLEATRERTDGATLNGGVRVDHSSAYGSFVSPSAAVAVPVSRAIALRGSASRGFRSPTWTERYYEDPANIGDPTLRPERFLAAEVGLGFLTSGPVSADVAAFVRDAESVIEWAKPSGADATTPWRTMNVAAATYHGIETGLEARNLVGADWRLHAMALRLETRGAAGFVGKYALRPVTGTIGLSVSVPVFQRFLLHLDGVHVTRSGEGSHVLASARLACHWRTFSATVDVLNLADAVYQDAAAKPAAGRAVYISGRWNLP